MQVARPLFQRVALMNTASVKRNHPPLWSDIPPHHTLLQWLSLFFLLIFCCYLLSVTGLLHIALASDRTFISIALLMLLATASVYCGFRAWWLGWQHASLSTLIQLNRGEPPSTGQSLAADYLDCANATSQSGQPLVDVFSDRARSGHEVLWFISGTMIKAGLVGTVIGFVQMLASVSTLESFDIAQMQEVLTNMSSGMGVALYTTLVGITCSVALGLQILLLDRSADQLVANTVRFATEQPARQ